MSETLANHEILTVAVYLLGGEVQAVDTEDVAVKANDVAPGRFTWRKYKDQINIEHVRAFLSDGKKKKYGGYLSGSGNSGWRLTPAGVAFARRHAARIGGGKAAAPRHTAQQKRWLQHERVRMIATDAFQRFAEDGAQAVTPRQCEQFFRIDEYVTGDARAEKVSRAVAAFGDDPVLGPAVRALAEHLKGNGDGQKAI